MKVMAPFKIEHTWHGRSRRNTVKHKFRALALRVASGLKNRYTYFQPEGFASLPWFTLFKYKL